MKKFLIVSCIILSGVMAFAQSTATISITQKHQAKRIRNGVISGHLTQSETKQLVHQQKLIQLQKRMVKADGVVTKKERARIRYNQSQANEAIYSKKHNKICQY